MRRLKDSTTFGNGGNFVSIDYDDTAFDDYNPCPVEVMFAKSKEQAQQEGSSRCIYPEFPDCKRIYFAMEELSDSLCISKEIGWERTLCVRKIDIPRIMELWYPDGTGAWDYKCLIDQIESNLVWIIGFGD